MLNVTIWYFSKEDHWKAGLHHFPWFVHT